MNSANISTIKSDRLTPALLAKAFRGELVPQDPNDEPASVLLERVKAIITRLPTVIDDDSSNPIGPPPIDPRAM